MVVVEAWENTEQLSKALILLNFLS